jgi:hypothetical protein
MGTRWKWFQRKFFGEMLSNLDASDFNEYVIAK